MPPRGASPAGAAGASPGAAGAVVAGLSSTEAGVPVLAGVGADTPVILDPRGLEAGDRVRVERVLER